MSAGVIISLSILVILTIIVAIIIHNISSNTICDSSKCNIPVGGTWIKDKCTCSCNPGYGGVNCQIKSKHVSDLETACKDKTGNACANCLKTNITQKLSGKASDVQQFKDDFISSIPAINNICCQNNCSNTSGTACDNCVSEKMTNLNNKLNTNDKTYEMNNMGCLSIVNKTYEINYIGKKTICSDSESPTTNIPQCPLTAGQVKKCSDVNKNSALDFSKRYQMCDKLLSDEREICTVNSQKTSCISTKKKCIHPNDTDGKLYGSDKCNFNGFYDSNKCQCPGMTNPYGWVGNGGSDIPFYEPVPRSGRSYNGPIIYYANDNSKCKTTCKQQGNTNGKLVKGCPCGDTSPDCHDTSCKPGSDHDPGRKCS